jgi:hypothetical protein
MTHGCDGTMGDIRVRLPSRPSIKGARVQVRSGTVKLREQGIRPSLASRSTRSILRGDGVTDDVDSTPFIKADFSASFRYRDPRKSVEKLL